MSGQTTGVSSTVPVTYGLTTTGFVKLRLLDCQAQIVAALNSAMAILTEDPTFQVDTRPDSVWGQIIATFAEREATLWEMVEAVYNSYYPVTASGTSLDNAVTFSGVTRVQEQQTVVYATLYGVDGTPLPFGTEASLASTGESFSLTQATTISLAQAVDVTVSVASFLARDAYVIIINNLTYTYVSQVGDGFADIIASLAGSVALSGLGVDYTATSSVRITSIGRVPFTISVSTNLNIDQLGSIGQMSANDSGPIVVQPGDLSVMETSVAGWTGLTNAAAGVTGQYQETDAALRTRYQLGVFQLGASVLPAIQANIQDNVPGVTSVSIIENTSDTALDSGQPPHSICCIVQGGDDLAVAQEILIQKPAGIATYGTTSLQASLPQGGSFIINFSRPQPVYVWVNVQTLLLAEETFPANGLAAEAQAILTYGQSLAVGQDVVIQRMYGPVYQAVSGISELNITTAVSTDPTYTPAATDYAAGNVSIGATQIASFAVNQVQVS